MKKSLIYKSSIVLFAAGAVSCANDYDKYDNSWMLDNPETMTLVASASSLELFEDTPPDEAVLTFTWTPARPMSDEYDLKYITYLDLKVNGFESAIRNTENAGVFERSYTTEQLQNYITENWGVSVSEETTLSFKVVATWEGGTKYVMPEVRTVDVDVQPYKPLVFEADVVYVSGSAKTGLAKETVGQTPENEYLYAKVVDLKEGELTIPVEYDGMTQYISPEMPGGFQDGVPVAAKMLAAEEDEVPEGAGWSIPSKGKYRVVIDMENKNVTIYSPENEFNKEFTVDWWPNNDHKLTMITTTLTKGSVMYMRGACCGWAKEGKVMTLTQSEADPQIFVYHGDALKDRTDFALVNFTEEEFDDYPNKPTDGVNNSYVLGPFGQPDASDSDGKDNDGNGIKGNGAKVTLGTWQEFEHGSGPSNEGGESIDTKGSYWQVPSGTNFIIFDMRNKLVKFEVR